MSSPPHKQDHTEQDDWLAEVLHHLDHLLPAQAPIRDFVHHNTLHGFQHLPFRQAISAAQAALGHRGYLPEAEFRRLHRTGRIGDADLLAAMETAQAESASDFPFATQPLPDDVDRQSFWLALLTAPTEPITRAALRWKIEEARSPAAGDALWQSCCAATSVNLQKKLANATLSDTATEKSPVDKLFDQIGLSKTWSDVLQALTGIDLRQDLTPPEVRLFAAGLDRGIAAWPLPGQQNGLYAAWREGLRGDPTQSADSNDLGRNALYAELPAEPAAAIALVLERYAIPDARRAGYLTRLALSLPGWTGMLRWHEDRAAQTASPTPFHLLDGLAILLASEYHAVSRLVFERWSLRPRVDMLTWYFREHPAEALIRQQLFTRPLPEALAARAARLIASVPNPAEGDDPEWQALAVEIARAEAEVAERDADAALAYPLWQVCRQAGISAATIEQDADGHLAAACGRLDTERRSYVWLLAYERAYRQKVLAVLAANQNPSVLSSCQTTRPSAQVLVCMDEREEGFRRHLEEVEPTVETLGAAGFFGIAMRWQGIDAESEVPLCPVVVTPTHLVREVARDTEAGVRHDARRQRRLAAKRTLFQRARHHLPSAVASTLAGAPLALSALAGRLFAPRLSGKIARRLTARLDGEVMSQVEFSAEKNGAASGFTDDEQAARVTAMLRTIGLVDRFAPLVAIVGHGSHSLNNPHASAYDCGACGGKHGGPNARVLAGMANRPEVRQRLVKHNIVIPSDTVFVAAQHDTCDDTVQWFDSAQIPETHRDAFAALRRQLDAAGQRHALERCRRFASAPDGISAEAALRHVAGRGDMPAQARPELGHVTNACAIIGRRALSRGSFLDRRCFLISYDPGIDDDGRILEGILLAAGPVGAGISLEYYFSTVNNAGYGCRSKVMHNLAGMIGVMEGTQSDLRTGLPQQMIEIHEAMRLLVICDAEPATLSAVVARQPALQELVGHGWISVVAMSPSTGQLSLFEPARGWLPWQPDGPSLAPSPQQSGSGPMPIAARSIDCFLDASGRFRRDALPPSLLRPTLSQTQAAT